VNNRKQERCPLPLARRSPVWRSNVWGSPNDQIWASCWNGREFSQWESVSPRVPWGRKRAHDSRRHKTPWNKGRASLWLVCVWVVQETTPNFEGTELRGVRHAAERKTRVSWEGWHPESRWAHNGGPITRDKWVLAHGCYGSDCLDLRVRIR
jgi:hypothetical protein